MAAPCKATTDYTCALAAIQSLKTDWGGPQFTQQQLIDRYPVWCSKGKINANGHLEEGGLALQPFLFVLKDLGLAATFRLGTGRVFLEANAPHFNAGVFLYTMNHENGQFGLVHCWRMHAVNQQEFTVVDTDRNRADDYLPIPWPYLDTFACTIIVCEPPVGP